MLIDELRDVMVGGPSRRVKGVVDCEPGVCLRARSRKVPASRGSSLQPI